MTEQEARLDALIHAYANARVARDGIDEQLKAAQKVEDAAATELFDEMERTNLRSVKHERGTFSLNDLAWAQVEDEDAARAWAEAEMPSLLTLNRQRLAVVVREHLKGERDAMPPGVGFTTSRKINWRRT